MRKTYRILADAIMVLVVIQAMMIVWSVAGLFKWVDDGNELSSSVINSWETDPPTFDGAIGHFIHVMSGTFLIPLLGLVLLIVAFFAKIEKGVMWATVVFVAIVVQVGLGISASSVPFLGALHGINAFILFVGALMAMRASKVAPTTEGVPVSV